MDTNKLYLQDGIVAIDLEMEKAKELLIAISYVDKPVKFSVFTNENKFTILFYSTLNQVKKIISLI